MDFSSGQQSPQSNTDGMSGVNGSNSIQATETNTNTNADELAELSSLFDLLDLEGNGDLDFPEFKVGLTSIGAAFSHDEATVLFEAIDAQSLAVFLHSMLTLPLTLRCTVYTLSTSRR